MLRGTISTTDGVPSAAFDAGFDVGRVMRRFGATTTPKVAIMGDSTSLPNGNNSIGFDDNLWGYLVTRLRVDNPNKTITFGNYAIGGTTMFNFNQTGTVIEAGGAGLPSWFSPKGNTWVSFVQTFAPDVIFFNWGVNDSFTFVTATMATLLTAVAAWTKVPDIIFITNKSANRAAGGNYALDTYQNGYLNAAALMRTVAQSSARGFSATPLPRIGVLDIGRNFQIAVNGFDPCIQALNVVEEDVDYSSFPHEFDATDGDLYLECTFVGQGADAFAAGSTITVGLGDPDGGNSASSFIQFSTTNGISYFVNYYGGPSVSAVSGNLNNWGADIRFAIHVSGSRLLVRTNDAECINTQVVRYAGPFVPIVSITSPWADPVMTVMTYAKGVKKRVRPILNGTEAYGPLAGSGNGINHDTSLALNSIDRWTLQRTSFSAEVNIGGQGRTVTAAGAITATAEDDIILVNKSVGAATTVNLPAQPIPWRRMVVKDAKGDAAVNNITITPAAGNIDGAATLVLNANYAQATIAWNGTQWYRIGA